METIRSGSLLRQQLGIFRKRPVLYDFSNFCSEIFSADWPLVDVLAEIEHDLLLDQTKIYINLSLLFRNQYNLFEF